MRRLFVTMCLSTATAGCMPTMNYLARSNAPEKAIKVEPRQPFRAPVVANQVTGGNAKDKAKALEEELDRDLQAAIEARDRQK